MTIERDGYGKTKSVISRIRASLQCLQAEMAIDLVHVCVYVCGVNVRVNFRTPACMMYDVWSMVYDVWWIAYVHIDYLGLHVIITTYSII
ncbi:hypothetical protein EON63_24500 [archaeon]|nr:MAG: hypothetical protein EON63_24500 [archaeon]